MEIILGISITISVVLLIRGYGLVKQIEQLSDIIVEYDERQSSTQTTLENLLNEMKQIDLNGSFESDDEVGTVFNELTQIIETYKNQI
jgi:predicted PurR-regulated permease PerM